MPPLDQSVIFKAAATKPMVSSEWQDLQDPSRNVEDADAGKFKWDGKFVANPALLGTWTSVAVVPTMEAFDPAKPVAGARGPFKEITFKDGGLTGNSQWIWSGDTLMHMEWSWEAMKMTTKGEYLFVEAGGFSEKNKVGWKPPLVVLKKNP